ncbi:magnesium transporter [Thermotoga sp. KOL6]|uniref:magnesium transporter n=1 Tax=Thermotoga sp. KOL6 TaxID=126741 RepID=UPI000C77F16F|nr:magnesium transporter [Thermotoga sp. KOL6]PLV59885.1 magnesium transporter [Thermotoga sp. KOL6]
MRIKVEIDLQELIEKGDFKTLKRVLEQQDPADVKDMIEKLPPDLKIIVFRLLPKDKAAEVFSELEPDDQMELIKLFREERLKEIFESMDPDDRVELLEEMPANVVKKLLSYLPPNERENILMVLNYPEDSAARLATTEYVELYEDMSVQKALEKVRKEGKEKENIYSLMVIDKTRKLKGTVELRDLIIADPSQRVSEIMDKEPIFVHATDDQELAAELMKKYDLMILPVVDSEERLIGVITFDDIVDVIEEEVTEDIQKMASMSATYTSYFHTPWWKLILKRSPWLVALLLLESVNGNIISRYESFLASIPVIAAFIPTMIGSAGNTGAQASALMIRGITLNEVKGRDWWKVLFRELMIGGVLGLILAGVLYLRAFLISTDSLLNFAVATALLVLIVYANVMGAILPFVARVFKIDPAFMAGPLLTTIVDVSGIMIYFYVVHSILT